MLFIQDPSYKNSMYLHETLLSECINSIKGGGAYAFATKDGINMLLTDENFKIFLTKGVYTLIVGTDDITNEHAVNALIELKQKYGKHLVVKAYIHKNKGSTFHPKFSWFQKKDGGSLVLGSGNLTQKGLRHNREAYSVIQHTTDEMEKVVAEWEEWYTHSAPFLFDIDDPIVMIRAKQNTEQTRAVSEAKASVRKEIAHSQANDELASVYENQPQDPKRVKIATPKKTSNISVKKEQEVLTTQVVITDEDVDIDASYWSITDESDVLIAEIPKSGDRWKQANFDKNTFENYFGATCGENGAYRILLKSVNLDGSMCETEIRPSVSVASQNYRFELEAANGLSYPSGSNRPIAVFARVSQRDFIYTLLMPGSTGYDETLTFMAKKQKPSARMRRLTYIAKDVLTDVPMLSIWKRLNKG